MRSVFLALECDVISYSTVPTAVTSLQGWTVNWNCELKYILFVPYVDFVVETGSYCIALAGQELTV